VAPNPNRIQLARMRKLVRDLEWACGGPNCLRTVYSDRRYVDYPDHRGADEWFLHFLTWGPWGEDERMCKRSRMELRRLGYRLGRISDRSVRSLIRVWGGQATRYPRYSEGAGKWLLGLNRYLRMADQSMRSFESRIRRLGWVRGRNELRRICDVWSFREGKALDCWLRDRLRVNSFPIDIRVREVLAKYKLEEQPSDLVRLAKALGQNPRVIARAANSLGPELLQW